MYFIDSYEECRDQFIKLSGSLQKKTSNTEIKKILIPSKIDNNLSIDICFIPAKLSQNNLIIISSGVHGIEGFAGSAIQLMIMEKILPNINPDYTSFLFIHSINPFGHKYFRRFTENNIDLNRNFDINTNLFSIKNNSYKLIYDFLNPKEKYADKLFENLFFLVKSLNLIKKYNIETLRQSILQGQYEFEKGIFFGGFNFEPQKNLLEEYILKKLITIKRYCL